MAPSSSPRFALNKTDIWKGVRGAIIVFASLFVVGGLEAVQNAFATGQSVELGHLEIVRPLFASGFTFLLEEARRFFTNYQR